MIEVEHLTKYYGSLPAVNDVTFNVEKGEILGFLGPNGAGKTTTMRMITGYLPPSFGTIRVAGYDMAEKSLEARAHLGYLPETVPLYTELTTLEYLDFRGRITGLTNTRERRARIYEVLDELNLADVTNKLIGTLSRGYRQRVGLAQAMLHDPDALILDEPTVGLDPVQITDVRNLIKELGRNHTVILSTHLLPEVSMVCNRVIIINRGRLVALDTPIHMTEQATAAQTIQLDIAGRPADILKTLRGVPGVAKVRALPQQSSGSIEYGATDQAERPLPVNDENLPAGVNSYQLEGQQGADVRSRLASAVVGAGYTLLEMKSVRPSLEDIFIKVISEEQPEEEAQVGEDGSRHRGAASLAQTTNESEDGYTEDEEAAVLAPVRTRVTAKRRTRR